MPLVLSALVALGGCVAGQQTGETAAVEPPPAAGAAQSAEGPVLDEKTALSLAAMPLACLDRPHKAPRRTGYLYELSTVLRRDYEDSRAFYGCYDWHSAVNSTWALVSLLDRYPEIGVAPLIVEKLEQHLSKSALAGEVEFFRTEGNHSFERPYGWGWFLMLRATLLESAHPRATAWAEATSELAEIFVAGLIDYLGKLAYPMRVGTHANTAFALDLARTYSARSGHDELTAAVYEAARGFFIGDTNCPLDYEPSGSDFLSPCLEEAKLMSVVLGREEFAAWLEIFLPAPNDPRFQTLRAAIDLGNPEAALDTNSHLIGLAFTRAEALSRIAAVLPATDPRGPVYRQVAAHNASAGMMAMFEADYLGSHWLGTFAVRYLITLP